MFSDKGYYLDGASTTKPIQEAITSMLSICSGAFYNPGTNYKHGLKSKDILEYERKEISKLFSENGEYKVVFTSGGSEANAMATIGLKDYISTTQEPHAITTEIEHHSVLDCFKRLEKEIGLSISYIKPDDNGVISLNSVKRAMQKNTKLVSIIGLNNETGVEQPVCEISKYIKEERPDIFIHSDYVAAIPSGISSMYGLNAFSLSAHKVGGICGVGALVLRDSISLNKLSPVFCGDAQEFGLRCGTEPLALIQAMRVALEKNTQKQDSHDRLEDIKVGFLSRLQRNIGLENVFLNAEPYIGSKIMNVRFSGVSGYGMILYLSNHRVYVSSGAACVDRSETPSHVLLAMGLTPEEAESSIRITFSGDESEEDLDEIALRFSLCYDKLINM